MKNAGSVFATCILACACSSGSNFRSEVKTPSVTNKATAGQTEQGASNDSSSNGANSNSGSSGSSDSPSAAGTGAAVTCDVNNFTVPIKLVEQTNTPAGKWWENSASLAIPSDATNIQLKIVSLISDDNSARIWINENLVVDLDDEDDNTEAHNVSIDNDISTAIRAGANTVRGRVFDRYGAFATLHFNISGTYKTGKGCKIVAN
jgi:hypothetical protein